MLALVMMITLVPAIPLSAVASDTSVSDGDDLICEEDIVEEEGEDAGKCPEDAEDIEDSEDADDVENTDDSDIVDDEIDENVNYNITPPEPELIHGIPTTNWGEIYFSTEYKSEITQNNQRDRYVTVLPHPGRLEVTITIIQHPHDGTPMPGELRPNGADLVLRCHETDDVITRVPINHIIPLLTFPFEFSTVGLTPETNITIPYEDESRGYLEAGTYYIEVEQRSSNVGADTGNYRITIDCFVDEEEPNNNISQAQQLGIGVTVLADFADGTEDFYRYELKEPGRLSVNIFRGDISKNNPNVPLTPLPQSGAMSVQWWSETEQIAAGATTTASFTIDNPFPTGNVAVLGTGNGNFSFPNPHVSNNPHGMYTNYIDLEAGTHYIRVARQGANTGSYSLRTSFVPANPDKCEHPGCQECGTCGVCLDVVGGHDDEECQRLWFLRNECSAPWKLTFIERDVTPGVPASGKRMETETVNGFLTVQKPSNFYEFTLTQPSIVTLNINRNGVLALPDTNNFRIRWYGEECADFDCEVVTCIDFSHRIISTSGTSAYGNPNPPVFVGLESGTYLFEITGHNNIRGSYDLSLIYQAANRTQEGVISTHATAREINPGDTVRGLVSLRNNAVWTHTKGAGAAQREVEGGTYRDIYKVDLDVPGRLTVGVTRESNREMPNSAVNIRWQTANEDKTGYVDFRLHSNSLPHNGFVDLEKGVYYIMVERRPNHVDPEDENFNNNMNNTGIYTLSVDFLPAGNNEIEPNNSRDEAQLLAFGQDVRGFLSHTDSTDWYEFIVTTPGVVLMNINNHAIDGTPNGTGAVIGGGAHVRWRDSTGKIISGTGTNTGADGIVYTNNAYTPHVGLEPGTYFVEIASRGSTTLSNAFAIGGVISNNINRNNTGTYNLKLDFTPANRTPEADMVSLPSGLNFYFPTKTNARNMTTGQTVRGMISIQEGVDIYRVVVDAPGILSIDINNGMPGGLRSATGRTSLGAEFRIHCYEPNNTPSLRFCSHPAHTLHEVNYSTLPIANPPQHGGLTFTNNESHRSMAVEAGIYYFAVQRFDSRVENDRNNEYINNGNTGIYTITVNVTPVNNHDNEPNNTREDADELMLGVSFTGMISLTDNVDFYRVHLQESGRLTITINSESIPLYGTRIGGGLPSGGAGIKLWEDNIRLSPVDPNANLFLQHPNPSQTHQHLFNVDFGTSIAFPTTSSFDLEKSINTNEGIYYIQISRAYVRTDTSTIGSVSGRCARYNSLETGLYNIKVDFTSAENDGEKEPNNTIEEAQGLSNGQTITGFLSLQDNIDVFKYTLEEPGDLTVGLTNGTPGVQVGTSGNFRTRILNSDGQLITARTSTGANMPANQINFTGFLSSPRTYYNLPDGDYYIEISRTNLNATGSYRLSVSCNTKPKGNVTKVTINTPKACCITGIVPLSALVEGTNLADRSVNWRIMNPDKHVHTVIGTLGGVLSLSVHEDESLDSLTIKATSVFDTSKFHEITLTLLKEPSFMITVLEGANGRVTGGGRHAEGCEFRLFPRGDRGYIFEGYYTEACGTSCPPKCEAHVISREIDYKFTASEDLTIRVFFEEFICGCDEPDCVFCMCDCGTCAVCDPCIPPHDFGVSPECNVTECTKKEHCKVVFRCREEGCEHCEVDYCDDYCLKPTCDDCIFAHRAACTFAACATRPAGSTPSTALRGEETFLAGECRFGGMGDVSHVGSVTGAGALLAFRASMNDAAVVGNIDYLAAYVNGQSPPTANAGRPTGAQALLIFRRSMNDAAVVFVNPPKPTP
jgi:hypothetical protein